MSQAPYSWQLTGSCPVCGSPIYGRVQKPGLPTEGEPFAAEEPEGKRTCPPSCPHGKLVST